MMVIKPSRIIDNERQVLTQLAAALAGKIGVDKDGWLWLCNVRIGKVSDVKTENGEKTL
jgi:plasmid maintenance system antidote protein VapI